MQKFSHRSIAAPKLRMIDYLADLWIVLQLHFEHPHGRLRSGHFLTGAHFIEQVAKAHDVDILDFRYRARPHDGVVARVETQ